MYIRPRHHYYCTLCTWWVLFFQTSISENNVASLELIHEIQQWNVLWDSFGSRMAPYHLEEYWDYIHCLNILDKARRERFQPPSSHTCSLTCVLSNLTFFPSISACEGTFLLTNSPTSRNLSDQLSIKREADFSSTLSYPLCCSFSSSFPFMSMC